MDSRTERRAVSGCPPGALLPAAAGAAGDRGEPALDRPGGGLAVAYDPHLTMAWRTAAAAAGICCLALGLTPLALEGWEELQWNRSITKKNGAEKG